MLRGDDKHTILHVRVNCTEDVAINSEATSIVGDKRDCLLLPGSETESFVIVMNYCESMYFPTVIIDDSDDHGVALLHSDDRPLCAKRFVVATVHACERIRRVRLYNRKTKYLTADRWRRLAADERCLRKCN